LNNYNCRFENLNNYPQWYWPPTMHMVYQSPASDDKQIAMLQEVIDQGILIRQAFKQQNHPSREDGYMPRIPVVLAGINLLAIEKGKKEILRYLWSE
jgi:hypothetical protein